MDFYQYYVKRFDYQGREREHEGIIVAASYANAAEKIENDYDGIIVIEIENIGGYLDREIIEGLTWRERKDFTELDDCNECKI